VWAGCDSGGGTNLEALHRVPTSAFGPISPTIDRVSASLPHEAGEPSLAKLAELQTPVWASQRIRLDGTACELHVGSAFHVRWQKEAAPLEWQPLTIVADDLMALVEEVLDAET